MRDITAVVLPSDALRYFTSRVGREVYGWDDATTPRTDKPVRFNKGLHQYDTRLDGRLVATFIFSRSFTYRTRRA